MADEPPQEHVMSNNLSKMLWRIRYLDYAYTVY